MTDSTKSGPPGAVGRVTRRSLLAGAGVAPTGVRTAMVLNEATYRWAGGTGPEDLERALRSCNTQPVGLIEPEDWPTPSRSLFHPTPATSPAPSWT